jgi:spore germination protein
MRDAMIIHVVKQGETISSIAEYYGVSVERLALENGVPITVDFTVGETLVILKPEIVYEVQEGDTLTSIASGFNISIMELLRNNPYLSERENIYPGEHLVIKYYDVKIDTLSTNGYVYPFVSINVLKKPYRF